MKMQVQMAEKKSHELLQYSYCLNTYYDWLYCMYVPSDNEFVRIVCRSKKKLRNTTINTTYQYDTTKRII